MKTKLQRHNVWNNKRAGRLNMAPAVHSGRCVYLEKESSVLMRVFETGCPFGTVKPNSVHYPQWPLEEAVHESHSLMFVNPGSPSLSRPLLISLCSCCSVWLSNKSGPVPLYPRNGGSCEVQGWRRRPTVHREEVFGSLILTIVT